MRPMASPWKLQLRNESGAFGASGHASQAGTGGEETGRLSIDQFHVIGFCDVHTVEPLELEKLAFYHHLG